MADDDQFGGDEEMVEVEVEEAEVADDNDPTGLEDNEPILPERTTFLRYAELLGHLANEPAEC